MNRIGHLKRLTGLFPLTIVIAVLALQLGASPASAAGTCAQDLFTAAGNTQRLNCSANDVSITGASNPRDLSGNPLPNCVSGQPFNLLIDFTVVSTSNKTRSNVGLYLGTVPVGQPGSSALTGSCDDNILSEPHLAGQADSCPAGSTTCLGDQMINGGVGYTELDGSAQDNCGDAASKTTHIVTVELDGVICPAVNTAAVVLPDCTTWQVPGSTIACSSNPGAGWPFVPSAAIPGSPSKCSCGQVSIPVTPINPTLGVKKSVTPASIVEPGGAFHYTAVITNTTKGTVDETINQLCDDRFGNIATATTNPAQPACPAGNLCPAGSVAGSTCATNIVCPLPAMIADNTSVTCTFDGTVTGTEPMMVTDTVTANGVGSGVVLSAHDSATVSIGEATAKAQVKKTLDHNQECATARYIVEVDNISPVSTDESVSLTGTTPLLDSKFGDVTKLGSKGVGLSLVGTTCGVAKGSFGLGTMASGTPGALQATGNLADSIAVNGNYTCEFDGQFCSGLSSVTGCTTGLQDQNTITATLEGDETEAVTGDNTATLTVDSCFTTTP